MREKQEVLKREGERERDGGSLSMYTRWGGVIRDDGNIKSGEQLADKQGKKKKKFHAVDSLGACPSRRVPDAVLGPSDVAVCAHA